MSRCFYTGLNLMMERKRNVRHIKSGVLFNRNIFLPLPSLFFPIVSLAPNYKIFDVDFVNQTKTVQQLTKITITSNTMFIRGLGISEHITTDEDMAIKEFLAVT